MARHRLLCVHLVFFSIALSLIMAVKLHSIYFSALSRWNLSNLVALAMPLRFEFVYFMRLYARES